MRHELLQPTRYERVHKLEFDSLADMRQAISKVPGDDIAAYPNRDSFVGRALPNWRAVWRAIETPWQEGLKIVDDMRTRLIDKIPQPVARVRRRRWNQDDGDDICRDRLQCGQDFWRQTVRQEVGAPQHVTIVTNMATSCMVDAENILWRGAAAVALCDLLEAAGYRCDVLAMTHGSEAYRNGDDALIGVWLKRSGDQVDLASLVNAVSGWAFRTVWFAAHHVAPAKVKQGIGFPKRLSETAMSAFIPGPWLKVDDAWSFQAALDCVVEQLGLLHEVSHA